MIKKLATIKRSIGTQPDDTDIIVEGVVDRLGRFEARIQGLIIAEGQVTIDLGVIGEEEFVD